VVAVAGSNGKTATKELVRAALGAAFEVHATTGNLNNQVGVPLTLLAIPDSADVAVVEVGTNYPGEVELLRGIVEPTVAVVTSIGEEHLEGFGSVAGVLREEASIFAPGVLAVCPANHPEVGSAARAVTDRVVEAGLDSGDVVADAWGLEGEGRPWLALRETRVSLPLHGAHKARNAMLAVAVARAFGVSDEVVARGIAAMGALPMRSARVELGTLSVINDAYNANPASAREALTLLDAVEGDRQRVVVLGSMLELGAQSAALHEEIARRALASRAQIIAGVGEFARPLEALASDPSRIITAADAEALWPKLAPRLDRRALVLLKGSRGMRLERLMPHLATFAGVAAAESAGAAH
jgi:UDP-N-acetylmuramoyl-tripeptide--D-alanyl-D-alanine ligase